MDLKVSNPLSSNGSRPIGMVSNIFNLVCDPAFLRVAWRRVRSEERQRPEMEIEVILARGRRVFNQVRLWQPEHAGGVGTLPDFAAHKVTNLLGWSVDPVVFHAIKSEYVASSPLKIRERTDRDRSRFDLQRLWVEPKLLP